MRLIILILSAGISFAGNAQTPVSANQNEFDWAAYFELVLPADPLYATADEDENAEMAILKLSTDDGSLSSTINHSLNMKLWDMAREEVWEIYEDANLTRQIDFNQAMLRLNHPDTVVTFDPETYEEKLEIQPVVRALPFEVEWVKVRQQLLYNNVTAHFEIRTLAIAALWNEGDIPYWLKVPQKVGTGVIDLDNKDINWAVRYTTLESTPGPGSWEETKNNTGAVIQRFIDRIRNDGTIELYDAMDNLISAAERPCMFSCIQNITVFDPETYQEQNQEIAIGIDHEVVSELQLTQEWFWNDREDTLETVLIAVAPRFWVINTEGLTYPKIIFQRRCD